MLKGPTRSLPALHAVYLLNQLILPGFTSRRIHANCLQRHIILPDYSGYFTSFVTCGPLVYCPLICLQN